MMINVSTPQTSKAMAAKPHAAETAWRGRLALVCALLVLMVLGLGAAGLDWSAGPAMALGQLAGMAAPLVVLMLLGWALAAVCSRPR